MKGTRSGRRPRTGPREVHPGQGGRRFCTRSVRQTEGATDLYAVDDHFGSLNDAQIEDVAVDSIGYVRGFNLDRGCASGSQRVLVIVNKAEHPKTIPLSIDKTALQNCTKADVPLGDEISVQLSADKLQLVVQPEGVAILRLH